MYKWELLLKIPSIACTILWANATYAFPLKGTLRLLAPQTSPLSDEVAGKLSYQGGRLALQDWASRPTTASFSITVDPMSNTALFTEGTATAALSITQLKTTKFSQILSTPQILGSLAFVGARLSTQAKLLRRTTFEGHEVELYFYRESPDVFGEIYYSPLYHFPLKIDSYNATTVQRSILMVENIR